MKKKSFVLFACLLVMYEMACYLAMDAYTPALPSIKNAFNVSYDSVQWTITAWMAGGIVPQIIIGPCSDHYGRKPVLLLGGLLFILSSIACAMSTTLTQLLIARFFQGMVIPSMLIAGYASVHELLDQQQAIQAVARMQSVILLAPAMGPLLGGILLTHAPWPWIFIVLACWGFISLSGLVFAMPESLPPEKRSTTLNITNIITQYVQCSRNPKFMMYLLAVCGLVGTIVIWVSASPLLIIEHYHYSTLRFGVCQAVIFSAFILGTKLIQPLTHLNGDYSRVTRFGTVTMALGGLLCLLASLVFHEHLLIVIVTMMIVMLGVGVCFSVFMRLAIDASSEPMGVRMSLLTFGQTLIATLSSIIVIVFYYNTLLSLCILIAIYSLIPGCIFTINNLNLLKRH
jgi:Bcr/CflA subfamily drug resistance transporter